jgi:hypothetical protein
MVKVATAVAAVGAAEEVRAARTTQASAARTVKAIRMAVRTARTRGSLRLRSRPRLPNTTPTSRVVLARVVAAEESVARALRVAT